MAETTHPAHRTSGGGGIFGKLGGLAREGYETVEEPVLEAVGGGGEQVARGTSEALGKKSPAQVVTKQAGKAVGKSVTDTTKEIAEVAYKGTIGLLFKGAGTQLVQIVLGGALLILGLLQLGKSGMERF